MKAICPVSGIPFRTYDSLALQVACDHPIFSIPFEQLVLLLEDIREQEEDQIKNISDETLALQDEVKALASIKDLTNIAIASIHEKNWRNPVFKLYQTKHLVLLALMKQAELLENEHGYAARPSPSIIDAYFWAASEVFIWAATIKNPTLRKLPKYRISKQNEDMSNFDEYLDLLTTAKDSFGSKFRTFSEENRLRAMEQALAILSRRREAHKRNLTDGNNHLAARWALTITRCPKDIYNFWYAILSSPSIKITFDGVTIDGIQQNVTQGDLRELRDYLEDNLIGPRGEPKRTHLDDSEYYFMARQTVLNIVRKHIAILEQGTSSYRIVNTIIGDEILSASDDSLERKGLEYGLNPKPLFSDYENKIAFIRAIAAWRNQTKEKLLELKQPKEAEVKLTKEERNKYEIL